MSRRDAGMSFAAIAGLLALGLGACSPPPEEKSSSTSNAPAAAAPVPAAWPSFAGRQSVKEAFDRKAGVDRTDRTMADCADVHAVMSCPFVIDAFARDVPEEAAAFKGPNGAMPDELLEIAAPNSELVANIDLNGSGATPARRHHFLGQFKTLMRVLSPGIDVPGLDQLVEDLQLGATPQAEVHTNARRSFANITCVQTGLPSASIQCQAEKP